MLPFRREVSGCHLVNAHYPSRMFSRPPLTGFHCLSEGRSELPGGEGSLSVRPSSRLFRGRHLKFSKLVGKGTKRRGFWRGKNINDGYPKDFSSGIWK